MRETVLLFTSIRESVTLLTDEQAGQLFKAILDYQTDNEVKLDGLLNVIFTPIKQQIDYNNAKWDAERKKRSEAGKKGMKNRWKKEEPDNNVITEDNNVITMDNNVMSVITQHNNEYQSITEDNKLYQAITKITDNVNVNVNDNVNDIEKRDTREKINYQEIVDLFNSTCKSLPHVRSLSDSRKRTIKARLKKHTIDDFKALFEKAEGSDFLKGINGGWQANFDWLMNENNMAKVLDGNYENRTGRSRNNFNNFPQNTYDFDELERQLLDN